MESGQRLLADPAAMTAWRTSLGLTRRAMAEMLDVTMTTYRTWETSGMVGGWRDRAARVGRYHRLTVAQLQKLSDTGVTISELMPLRVLAGLRGLTAEGVFAMYRAGEIPDVVDLGVLGLWVPRGKQQSSSLKGLLTATPSVK